MFSFQPSTGKKAAKQGKKKLPKPVEYDDAPKTEEAEELEEPKRKQVHKEASKNRAVPLGTTALAVSASVETQQQRQKAKKQKKKDQQKSTATIPQTVDADTIEVESTANGDLTEVPATGITTQLILASVSFHGSRT